MRKIYITAELMISYAKSLRDEERSEATVVRYTRALRQYGEFLSGNEANRVSACAWRESLAASGRAASGINVAVAAVNRLFDMLGAHSERIKPLRVQRKVFRPEGSELTRAEYERLIDTAHAAGRERLALLLEAICATGIRVSEVRYLSVEAVRAGRAEIRLKGKVRYVLLPGKLCRKLMRYAKAEKISSGELFVTRTGRGLTRGQIWAEMKSLCAVADVEPGKVFPHNLRHLFARTFYRVSRDIARLADVLGHSSIETTRIYLLTTSAEHERTLEKLGLVS